MIVVSGSLPKSASTWLFNVTDALLVAAGHLDAQTIRRRYRLDGVLTSKCNEISYASPSKLARLLPVALRGRAVLTKTHLPPSRSLRAIQRARLAKLTYIYRDPRDVALSALDHGRRARQRGFGHELGRLHTVEDAIHYTRRLLVEQWEPWMNCPGVLGLRYEDITTHPTRLLRQLARHLALEVPEPTISSIAERFDPAALPAAKRNRMLIHKARPGRFRDEMTPAQRRLADRCLGDYLRRMGYVRPPTTGKARPTATARTAA